jgi:hypothetical protein
LFSTIFSPVDTRTAAAAAAEWHSIDEVQLPLYLTLQSNSVIIIILFEIRLILCSCDIGYWSLTEKTVNMARFAGCRDFMFLALKVEIKYL